MLTLLSPIANHLWQSTVFVIVAAALALALRKNRAGIRHWIWCIASLKFIVPLSLFITWAASSVGLSLPPYRPSHRFLPL
jgi:hypothetical protein